MLHCRPSRPQPAPRALCGRQTACPARHAPVRLTQCALLDTICHCTPFRRAGRRAGTETGAETSTCAESAREMVCAPSRQCRTCGPGRASSEVTERLPSLANRALHGSLVHCDALVAHVYLRHAQLSMHSVLSPSIQAVAGCQPSSARLHRANKAKRARGSLTPAAHTLRARPCAQNTFGQQGRSRREKVRRGGAAEAARRCR